MKHGSLEPNASVPPMNYADPRNIPNLYIKNGCKDNHNYLASRFVTNGS